MARLYVPIGIPGSGKSTWARTLLTDAVIVSTDHIRAEVPGGYVHDPEANARIFDTFHERIGQYLALGHVVADATNLQWKHRAELIALADVPEAELHYLLFTNVAQAVLRNARREGVARVPDEAMLKMVAQYEVALAQVPGEPYDSLTYIERVE